MTKLISLPLYDGHNTRPVARIEFQNYTVDKGLLMGQDQGRLRSFRTVSGSLRRAWWHRLQLQMNLPDGQTLAMRVAALPVDADSYGMLEILPLVL